MKTILPLALVSLIAVALYFLNSTTKTVHEAPSPSATIHTIKEKFITDFNRADNIDSMVVYKDPTLGRVLIATAKNSNALVVYSAETGKFIKRVTDVGFVRPNGITMFPDKDILVVVERDGHQMVFVSLPDFKHIGSFGESVLIRPYASAVVKTSNPNVYNIFVTDNYMDLEYSEKHGKMKPKKVPPVEMLDGRVQMFQVTVGDDGHSLTDMKHLRKVGDNFGDGALHVVETIVADEEMDNLLIADERQNNIKVYKLSTLTFTGVLIGNKFFEVDPEGFALYKCKDGTGFWVTTEQLRHPHKTKFHLFDRTTFVHVGSFSGEETRMTDGVALTQDAFGPFNAGAFYAAHGDASIAAFSIEDIAKTLNIPIKCTNPK